MNTSTLTPLQRNVRSAVRGFLLVATPEELQRELVISQENRHKGDEFRAQCIQEIIDEADQG